jgi:glycosyltransferase involved in cell wall biosynthesis
MCDKIQSENKNMPRKHAKISVVIPAHNEAKIISKTLEAILAQKYPDFEVIVVDNASYDGTAEVVFDFLANIASQESYIHNRVRVVTEPRKGLLYARECGRKESRGDIIANIDADCLPETDWLDVAEKYFHKHADVVAVSGPYDYYDAHPYFKISSKIMQNYIYRPISHILQWPFIRGGAVLIGGNNLIRADILKKIGGYDTRLTFYGEDTNTAKRMARHGRVIFSPKIVMKTSARRFRNEGSLTITIKYLYHFFKQLSIREK